MPRGQPLDLANGTKHCPKCNIVKPLSEFYKDKSTAHGYQVYCKLCCYIRHNNWRLNNLAHAAAEHKKHRRANPERHADYARKSAYGLAPGEFDRLLEAQQGKCAICRSSTPGGRGRFHVDHCHDTKRIRGLLCPGCNVSIGHFKHDRLILQAAIDYLAKAGREG